MGYLGALFIILTLQGDTDGPVYVKEAKDSSKNEKYRDGGRAMEKAKKRAEELEKELKSASNNKEKTKIKNKISRERKNALS